MNTPIKAKSRASLKAKASKNNTRESHTQPDAKEVASKVISYLEEHFENFDKKSLLKFIPIAILLIYGIRKSNFLLSMILPIATGLITKYFSDRSEAGEVHVS